MKTVKLRVRETSEVIHIVEVPDDFTMYSPENLDDWAQQIGEQVSSPVEICDIQVDSVISAEVVVIN
jgi:hypothetical protein